MENMNVRLREARERAGFENATAAAERFGWRPSTYLGHENGSRGFRLDKAQDYARAFKVAPEWLIYGQSENPPEHHPEIIGTDLVPVFNIYASAGHGALVGSEEIVDRLEFPSDYLRHITKANPKHLAIIGVKGDSMHPTIKDDDLVMLDMSKQDLSYDGLFVIRDGGDSLLVKRITRAARKDYVLIKSDNAVLYPPTERHVSEIEVVGKVVWMGVKV